MFVVGLVAGLAIIGAGTLLYGLVTWLIARIPASVMDQMGRE